MLEVLKDEKYFPEIMALAEKFPEGGARGLNEALVQALSNPYRFLILADIDHDVLQGFLFLNIAIWNGERVAFVRGYAYNGKMPKDILLAGWKMVKDWSSGRNIRALLGFTQRPKGFIRAYKCQVVSAVVRKELV